MLTSRPRPQPGKPARRKKSYHHGDLRRALLREARRALDADGPADFSLRDVARRAGVSPAAPYRHFSGKEGMLAALAEEGFRELGRNCRRAGARRPDPLAKFYAFGDAYLRFAVRNPQVYRLMFGSVRKRWDADVAAAGDEAFAVLVDMIRECQQAGVIRGGETVAVGATTTSLCHGIASLWLDGRAPPNASVPRFTRRALETLVEGLRARTE